MRAERRDEFDAYRDSSEEFMGLPPPRFLPHCVFVIIVIGCVLAAVHYFAGKETFNATLRGLASPVGIVWLFILLAAYWVTAWRVRLAALLCWSSWLILTLAGSSLTSNWLIGRLEQPYAQSKSLEMEKFDAILVLGGGTDTTPAGVPQLGMAGDRLIMAARMYNAGKVDTILVSGVKPVELGQHELELYDESARLLVSLNIPESAIERLREGSDTAGELRALKTWLEGKNAVRVGLLSSAWHLPRVMKLAERYQIQATPIPANFLSESPRIGPGMVIPSAINLYVTGIALKEYLGLWLDR